MQTLLLRISHTLKDAWTRRTESLSTIGYEIRTHSKVHALVNIYETCPLIPAFDPSRQIQKQPPSHLKLDLMERLRQCDKDIPECEIRDWLAHQLQTGRITLAEWCSVNVSSPKNHVTPSSLSRINAASENVVLILPQQNLDYRRASHVLDIINLFELLIQDGLLEFFGGAIDDSVIPIRQRISPGNVPCPDLGFNRLIVFQPTMEITSSVDLLLIYEELFTLFSQSLKLACLSSQSEPVTSIVISMPLVLISKTNPSLIILAELLKWDQEKIEMAIRNIPLAVCLEVVEELRDEPSFTILSDLTIHILVDTSETLDGISYMPLTNPSEYCTTNLNQDVPTP